VHVSTDDALDPTDCAIDVDETVECCETNESSDPFRSSVGPDDLRGGRLGASCEELRRLGRGGGTFKLGSSEGLGISRSTGGGGKIPFDLTLAG